MKSTGWKIYGLILTAFAAILLLLIVSGRRITVIVSAAPSNTEASVPDFFGFREKRLSAERNTCRNILRMIDGAKEQCALERRMTHGDDISEAQIRDFIPARIALRCPSGGTYAVNKVGISPTCSAPGHSLPTL